MNDATAARHSARSPAALGRRRILQLALALPAVAALAGCGGAGDRGDEGPDPLITLADAARADAALATAAIAADPALAARIDPLRQARTEHATALDAEVARLGWTTSAAPTPRGAAPPTAAPAARVTLAQLREAVAASHVGAVELVEDLPAERVGLVAAVAACCATYAALLA